MIRLAVHYVLVSPASVGAGAFGGETVILVHDPYCVITSLLNLYLMLVD